VVIFALEVDAAVLRLTAVVVIFVAAAGAVVTADASTHPVLVPEVTARHPAYESTIVTFAPFANDTTDAVEPDAPARTVTAAVVVADTGADTDGFFATSRLLSTQPVAAPNVT